MGSGSQEQRLLDFIRKEGETSTLAIVKRLNITSPTKTISNLRKKGFPIVDVWKTATSYEGKVVRYKAYSLEERT